MKPLKSAAYYIILKPHYIETSLNWHLALHATFCLRSIVIYLEMRREDVLTTVVKKNNQFQ